MNKLQGKKVFIFQQRNWGQTIGHFLAKKLQTQGCRLAALTLKQSTHEFTLSQREVRYDLVVNDDEILNNPFQYLPPKPPTLAEVCAELGIESVWPLVQTIRNYVKSYREKFYYSYRQNVTDEHMVAYVQAIFELAKKVFSEFGPDLILAPNFVVLPHIIFNLYGKKHGVKMIAVTYSTIKGFYIFTHSFLEDEGLFFDQLRGLNARQAESKNRARARQYIREFRENFKKPDYAEATDKTRSLRQIIRHELSPFYHILRWYWRKPINYFPNLGPILDYRPPRIIWRDHFVRKRNQKLTDRFSYHPFERLKKFVYFPLQFQPEAVVDVTSPFFSNQIETARLVAMSLPDDYTLVAKEHPAMVGFRSPSYIEKIARTPNVKLIDYHIESEEVLKRADLIVSFGSATATEAAFYCKPVIQLGNFGVTRMLPNVFQHTDMTILSGKIKELLKSNLHNADYEQKLENFVTAAYDAGFDFDYGKAWRKGGDMEELWEIYRKEIEAVI